MAIHLRGSIHRRASIQWRDPLKAALLDPYMYMYNKAASLEKAPTHCRSRACAARPERREALLLRRTTATCAMGNASSNNSSTDATAAEQPTAAAAAVPSPQTCTCTSTIPVQAVGFPTVSVRGTRTGSTVQVPVQYWYELAYCWLLQYMYSTVQCSRIPIDLVMSHSREFSSDREMRRTVLDSD